MKTNLNGKPAIRALSLALALSIAGAGTAFAAPPGGPDDHRPQQQKSQPQKQQPQNQHQQKQKAQTQEKRQARPEFRAQDSREVRNYFQHHQVKRHALPKGVHLRVGYKRPVNVRYQAVPAPLLKKLPNRPGYHYYMAGDDVILVAITTGIIVDILTSVHNH